MEFFNSNFFVGLATIITGGVVIFLYWRQKRSFKINAAKTILIEIRAAEELIPRIKELVEKQTVIDLPSILSTNNWRIYSHLFVADFDQDELRLLNSFYTQAESIEEFVKRNNNFFWITTEERARVYQQKLGQIILDSINDVTEDGVPAKRQKLLDLYNVNSVEYTPSKPFLSIKENIDNMQFITTSSCGLKLKKLAKLSK